MFSSVASSTERKFSRYSTIWLVGFVTKGLTVGLGQGLADLCYVVPEANNSDLSSAKSFMSSLIEFT